VYTDGNHENIQCYFHKCFLRKVGASELRIIIQNYKDDAAVTGHDKVAIQIKNKF